MELEQKKMQNEYERPEWMNNPDEIRKTIKYLQAELAKLSVADSGSKNLQERVAYHLKNMGVPQHIRGYRYLKECLVIATKDPSTLECITKELYMDVAKKCKTTHDCVESSIRLAIKKCYDRGDQKVLLQYFGNTISYSKGKPTNSEFMVTMVSMLRHEMGLYEDA